MGPIESDSEHIDQHTISPSNQVALESISTDQSSDGDSLSDNENKVIIPVILVKGSIIGLGSSSHTLNCGLYKEIFFK